MTDCLKIVDKWIEKADQETKKKLFMLQDFIRNDLEYTRRAESMLEMTEFLESMKQGKDVIIVRKYVNL